MSLRNLFALRVKCVHMHFHPQITCYCGILSCSVVVATSTFTNPSILFIPFLSHNHNFIQRCHHLTHWLLSLCHFIFNMTKKYNKAKGSCGLNGDAATRTNFTRVTEMPNHVNTNIIYHEFLVPAFVTKFAIIKKCSSFFLLRSSFFFNVNIRPPACFLSQGGNYHPIYFSYHSRPIQMKFFAQLCKDKTRCQHSLFMARMYI